MTVERWTTAQAQRVTVTDVDMPFMSMVTFMVKWAIAAIPAALIPFVVGFFVVAAMSGAAQGLSSVGAVSDASDSIAAYESDFARWRALSPWPAIVNRALF